MIAAQVLFAVQPKVAPWLVEATGRCAVPSWYHKRKEGKPMANTIIMGVFGLIPLGATLTVSDPQWENVRQIHGKRMAFI